MCSRLESSFFVRSSSVLAHSLHFDIQIDHLQFPCRCSTMASMSNPSELSLQPRFRSARDQLRLYLSGMRWQHMHGRNLLSDTSKIRGSWTLVKLQALLDEPRGLLKHVTGSGALNVTRGGISSNASCIMSCLRPLTQKRLFPQQMWCEVVPNL